MFISAFNEVSIRSVLKGSCKEVVIHQTITAAADLLITELSQNHSKHLYGIVSLQVAGLITNGWSFHPGLANN